MFQSCSPVRYHRQNEVNKVYDPACGSGSLLLKVAKVLGRENIEHGFYGQEIDLTTYNPAASICSCIALILTNSVSCGGYAAQSAALGRSAV